jgi:hypothetical protein
MGECSNQNVAHSEISMDDLLVRQIDHSSACFNHHSNTILEGNWIFLDELEQVSFLHQFEHHVILSSVRSEQSKELCDMRMAQSTAKTCPEYITVKALTKKKEKRTHAKTPISLSNSKEASFTSFKATRVPFPSKKQNNLPKKKKEERKKAGRVTISSPHFAEISFTDFVHNFNFGQ